MRKNSGSSPKDSSVAQSEIPHFDPVFTTEEVEEVENNYNSIWGVKRRIMEVVLARSSEQLLGGCINSSNEQEDCGQRLEALVTAAEEIQEYMDHLRDGVRLAECSIARLVLVAQAIEES